MKFLKYISFALVFLLVGKITSSEVSAELLRLRRIKRDLADVIRQYKVYAAPVLITKFSDPSCAAELANAKQNLDKLNTSFMKAQLEWKLSNSLYYASSAEYFEQRVLNPALEQAQRQSGI